MGQEMTDYGGGASLYTGNAQGHEEHREPLTYIMAIIRSRLCPWTNRVREGESPFVGFVERADD
jgi:hypothetical protein